NAVARRLVMAPHREGGQAQFIPAPVGDEDRPWLAQLFDWVQRRLHEPLTIDRMARQANMSTRTLSRRFAETAGMSPGEWLIGLRVARAKDLLETSRGSVERIAVDCGFGSVATLRHHFRQRVHMSPAAYRARFHTAGSRSPRPRCANWPDSGRAPAAREHALAKSADCRSSAS
ncbi:MAG TPA: helix-turn-helix domain-containing protein, partial [Stellaceae bacterium]|nr:helix-turn-helix domain-containing protein [Stellaceae bacterium]